MQVQLLVGLPPTPTSAVPVPTNPPREPTVNGEDGPYPDDHFPERILTFVKRCVV